ncbi:DUF1206 domain-containing protein [Occultella glacieicola]|uniref:DUF1206 domain-containing protein n=1 Tax=Occultella glacieicola TaxID=2518684 RepID=A0ABY2E6N3_9MICO|nr:DUF1206 domain-containing protein [Occultella glacieicola]TDE94933.1 DUF1206 domain-containing protein [Occultella glacieicola]
MSESVRNAASDAGDHPVVRTGARVGYAASGVLHLLIGWIALRLAWGGGSGSADQSGALAELGSTPVGAVLLWVVTAGFVLLGLWQITELVGADEAKDKVKSLGKAVMYLVLAGTALRIAAGGSSGGGDAQTSSLTGTLMAQPFGRVLVAVVGAVVIGVGIHHVVKGARAKFLEDLRANPGRWITRAGRLGYIAKGIALALVGVFFVVAAVQADPEEAQGLDGALRSVLELPLGSVLLTVVALGIVLYGVYSFGRARYAKV